MKNKIHFFLALPILFLAWSSLKTAASDDLGCYDELREIVESSNSIKIKNKGDLIAALVVDTDKDDVIMAQLRLIQESNDPKNEDEWQGTQTAGWIKFYESDGLLYELPLNEDEPMIKLETQCSLIEKFKKCRDAQRNAIHSVAAERYLRVISKGRTYFYGSPDISKKEKNLFLIHGDIVKRLETSGEFTLASYTQKSGNTVEGWLKTEDLIEILYH